MNHRLTIWQRAGPFLTGALIGALAWTPTFAATPNPPGQWQRYLLIGSVVLLAIALMLKAFGTRRPRRGEGLIEPVDMRDANRVEMIDVPLHQ